MNSIKITIVIIFVFLGVITKCYSQNVSGKVTYASHKKIETLLDSTKYDKETIDKVQGFFAKQFQNEFVLKFNQKESVFSEEVKLSINGKTNSFEDKLYKNFNSKQYIHKKEILGKVFSIQDSITNKNWKVLNKTKFIGKYLCNKAELNYKKNDTILKVVAWFTYQIPINNGPDKYDGLPGLILQLDESNYTYLCKKIELFNEEIKLKIPKGGKVVNQIKFDQILEEKSEEGKERAKSILQNMESTKMN